MRIVFALLGLIITAGAALFAFMFQADDPAKALYLCDVESTSNALLISPIPLANLGFLIALLATLFAAFAKKSGEVIVTALITLVALVALNAGAIKGFQNFLAPISSVCLGGQVDIPLEFQDSVDGSEAGQDSADEPAASPAGDAPDTLFDDDAEAEAPPTTLFDDETP